jgi:tight adherence protein B
MTRTADAGVVWSLLAGGATVLAWYLRRPDDWLVLRLRVGGRQSGRGGRRPIWSTTGLPIAATVGVAVAIPSTTTQAAVVAFVAAGLFASRLRRQAMVTRKAAELRADVARVLSSVAAELRAGVDPAASVRAAVADGSAVWEPLRTATEADVVEALRSMSEHPGGEGLADVAAAWQIAEHTGSPLARVLERMAEAVRADVELDREVAVEAAPARATGRLMAVLPGAGLGLGMLLGADPVRVLLTSVVGVACLWAGLALACLGVWRIERIVTAVEAR